MQASGNCGRSARWYGDELEVLRGLLTTDDEPKVYPDDYATQHDYAPIDYLREVQS